VNAGDIKSRFGKNRERYRIIDERFFTFLSLLTLFIMAASTKAAPSPLLLCRLYRSLLKTAKPFTPPYEDAKVLTCLLHRTGLGNQTWESYLRDRQQPDADDVEIFRHGQDDDTARPAHKIFRRLLTEVIANSSTGIRVNLWPSTADPSKLRQVIRREFRDASDSVSAATSVDVQTRKEVAFVALRELNKKLSWVDRLEKRAPETHARQAARYVSPLPMDQPLQYLRPGAFLVAHPNLTGYFRRAVIFILDHTEEGEYASPTETTQAHGTYGLVVNRHSLSPKTERNMTLQEILRPLPSDLQLPFGGSFVREGGPVHMSLQMLHAATPEQEFLKIGGSVVSMITTDNDESTALNTNEAIYYRGDVMKAATAVLAGELEKDDVSFFVGASSWAPGQLENEIERGCWIPCRGPPQIAHSGICDHEPAAKGRPRPKADLWLSMLSACGEDEAKLAHLVWTDDGQNELGEACDDFR
jgi:putative AlgH/UPF0301 family transcriptional regulator